LAVRNSAKGIVLDGDRILLNKCKSRLGAYYALPGGGQHTGETLPEAVTRELLEETGIAVRPIRMAGVYEQITAGRGSGSDHKMYFIFLCELTGERRVVPTERDAYQVDCEWMSLDRAEKCRLFPRAVRDNLRRMILSEHTLYLGSARKK
jgi:8-oxo-dGTP diphosphatase